MPHKKAQGEKIMPKVHLDFMFRPQDSPLHTVPCLVVREVVSKMTMAAVVPSKTTGSYGSKRVLAFLAEVGCAHGDVIANSDQEPAVTSLVNEVDRVWSPADPNGTIERGHPISAGPDPRKMRIAIWNVWKVPCCIFLGWLSTPHFWVEQS